jgi:hypothetical protein
MTKKEREIQKALGTLRYFDIAIINFEQFTATKRFPRTRVMGTDLWDCVKKAINEYSRKQIDIPKDILAMRVIITQDNSGDLYIHMHDFLDKKGKFLGARSRKVYFDILRRCKQFNIDCGTPKFMKDK